MFQLPRKSKTFGVGRRCQQDSCDTILNQYNKGPYCSLHRPYKIVRVRGRKPAT